MTGSPYGAISNMLLEAIAGQLEIALGPGVVIEVSGGPTVTSSVARDAGLDLAPGEVREVAELPVQGAPDVVRFDPWVLVLTMAPLGLRVSLSIWGDDHSELAVRLGDATSSLQGEFGPLSEALLRLPQAVLLPAKERTRETLWRVLGLPEA